MRYWFLLLVICFLSGCTSDCIYKLYETSEGDELCGRFCPLEDEEGNTVLNDSEEVVYDKPETVDKFNCILPANSNSTVSSSSSTSG